MNKRGQGFASGCTLLNVFSFCTLPFFFTVWMGGTRAVGMRSLTSPKHDQAARDSSEWPVSNTNRVLGKTIAWRFFGTEISNKQLVRYERLSIIHQLIEIDFSRCWEKVPVVQTSVCLSVFLCKKLGFIVIRPLLNTICHRSSLVQKGLRKWGFRIFRYISLWFVSIEAYQSA